MRRALLLLMPDKPVLICKTFTTFSYEVIITALEVDYLHEYTTQKKYLSQGNKELLLFRAVLREKQLQWAVSGVDGKIITFKKLLMIKRV